MIPSKNVQRLLFGEGKEPLEKGRPTVKKTYREAKKVKAMSKENLVLRAHTEEKENPTNVKRVYHNFINKKKDKKMSHMWKIIENVVSEDIAPWNI